MLAGSEVLPVHNNGLSRDGKTSQAGGKIDVCVFNADLDSALEIDEGGLLRAAAVHVSEAEALNAGSSRFFGTEGRIAADSDGVLQLVVQTDSIPVHRAHHSDISYQKTD